MIKPFFIAGGINSKNVDEMLDKIACYGVDVSSGVENDNKKDEAKVQEFISQVWQTVRCEIESKR